MNGVTNSREVSLAQWLNRCLAGEARVDTDVCVVRHLARLFGYGVATSPSPALGCRGAVVWGRPTAFRFIGGMLSMLLMVFLSSLGWAAEQVRDMGSVRLWAQDRTAHQRNDILSEALADVVVRISGQQGSLSSNPVQQWLQRPADYLVSYVYEQPSQVELEDRQALGLATDGMWLKLIFDDRALSQIMRELGVPVWGNSRPRVVGWWGMDVGSQRFLIGRTEDSAQSRAFRRAAAIRGVPLVLPKLDAEDRSRIGREGVFGFAADPVIQGSKRYAADAILVGRAKRIGNRWQASWQLYANSESYWFEETADSVEALAELAFASVAEQLSSLYAVTTTFGENGQVGLRVIDVRDYGSYVSIQRYLERLNVVNKVHLSQVRGDQLQYQLNLDGDVGQLQKALSLGGKLVATGNAPQAWTLPLKPSAPKEPSADGAWGMPGAPTRDPRQNPTATYSAASMTPSDSERDAHPAVSPEADTTTAFPSAQLEYYWVGP